MNGSTYGDRFERNYLYCRKYFATKIKEFNIKDWKLILDKSPSAKYTLGITDYNFKVVKISYHFLRGPTTTEKEIRNTILHELAHVLVGSHHDHDKVWKTVALKIGCDGKVCSPMALPNAKFIMFCKKRCFANTYQTKPNNTNKVCAKCFGALTVKSLK